jgi:uncharacterized protein YneR
VKQVGDEIRFGASTDRLAASVSIWAEDLPSEHAVASLINDLEREMRERSSWYAQTHDLDFSLKF